MRFTLVFIFILVVIQACAQHEVVPQIGVYVQSEDVWQEEGFIRERFYGISLSLVHRLEKLPWAGSWMSLSYDPENEWMFNFGPSFRFPLFNKNAEIALLLPYINKPLNVKGKNTPIAIEVTGGKGKLRFQVREALFKNGITSRATVLYQF